MKVTIEIDCTPQEARTAMGLPDLTAVHERYLQLTTEAMEGNVRPEMLEAMMRSWSPMGEAGLSFWRQLMNSTTKPSGS
ncbi:DUF6489 family protein [Sphingomonas sp. KR1UV-12]|uniref:DUF6489 family protein n=1 Tax=Sphingomonas aurea TaxID=3063994 RepID=A0ABT9ELJ7_9SPHN|nr:DUF6489 family protein [Sphingomonas sp. KR1UV-12]MDP1027814.1 DUF6489 family protein [Sphingomonas sp. KR1UV-12]